MTVGRDVVVDTHHHFLPSPAFTYARKMDEFDYTVAVRRFSTAYTWMQDVERTLSYMDEAGIQMALINQCNWTPLGLETCKAINEGYAKIQREHPGKFMTCAHLPVEEGPVAIDELKRSIEELGLQGVSLLTSYARHTIDSEIMMPLFEKINHYKVPIVIHPSSRRPLWGGMKYELSTTVSREYDIAKSVTEILYGVLSRYPDLKFLVSHFGGGMPVIKERLVSWHQPEGWDLPDDLRGNCLTPRELKERGLWEDFHHHFDKMYFDSAGYGGSMIIMRAALEAVSRDRITFGTDYPFEFRHPSDVRKCIADIHSLEIPEIDKKKILGKNVLDLFNIS
jgi:predicted TIM-barrel fold metal-dependent hydrolase